MFWQNGKHTQGWRYIDWSNGRLYMQAHGSNSSVGWIELQQQTYYLPDFGDLTLLQQIICLFIEELHGFVPL